MKPNIVILNIYQLGTHTDTYNYCKYLKPDFNITYISFHQCFEDIQIDGIKTITIPQPRGFRNLIRGYLRLAGIVKKEKPDIVFLVYVRFISIVKFFIPGTRFIFDIRTGSLFENTRKRNLWNLLLRIESLSFKNITIISEGLRKDLHLPSYKCHWLPLGGNTKVFKRDQSPVRLLYIGTLDQRNIHYTLEGLAIFRKEFPQVPISYDIVGYGKNETEEKIRLAIIENKLEENASFHGRIPYDQIDDYLKKSNVGVVFIPVTPYYDHQPSTKLFEYLLAGIPVLATKTSENKSIVNISNGILNDDSPEGFSNGLKEIYDKIGTFNEDLIRNSVSEYSWEQIVKNHLKPLLYNILKDQKD